jgi:hypothetical protein
LSPGCAATGCVVVVPVVTVAVGALVVVDEMDDVAIQT